MVGWDRWDRVRAAPSCACEAYAGGVLSLPESDLSAVAAQYMHANAASHFVA